MQGVRLDLGAGHRLRDTAAGRSGRLRYAVGRTARNGLGPGAVLVRPDSVVARADGPGATRRRASGPPRRGSARRSAEHPALPFPTSPHI
ncbi:aromatic-ring hydroxylase C-terminal domain-containing protein [Streptomyces sp. NPDC002067]